MSAGYDNTNRGVLGKNTRKTTDKHPDITGSINVDGVEYFLDGWQKTKHSDGSKFYSLSVKRKEQQAAPAGSKPVAPTAADLSDEIPFAAEMR